MIVQGSQDERMGFIASLGGCSKVTCCVAGCIIANFLLLLVTFLCVFAALNPDKETWAGSIKIKGSEEGGEDSANSEGAKYEYNLYSDRDAGAQADANQMIDVHGRFVTWFGCGFFLSLTPVPIAILTLTFHIIHSKAGQLVGGIGSITVACGFTAWWILGLFWRFSELGQFVSGDEPYYFGNNKPKNRI